MCFNLCVYSKQIKEKTFKQTSHRSVYHLDWMGRKELKLVLQHHAHHPSCPLYSGGRSK